MGVGFDCGIDFAEGLNMTVILEYILSIFKGVAGLFNKVWDFFSGIPKFLDNLFTFLISYIIELPVVLLGSILSSLSDAINSVFFLFPLGFINAFLNFNVIFQYSSSLGFFLSPFRIGYGLSFIIVAYLIRFFIRRLPIVG